MSETVHADIPNNGGPDWHQWRDHFTGSLRAHSIDVQLEGWCVSGSIHPGYDDKTLVLFIDEVMPPEKPRQSISDMEISPNDAVDLIHMLIGYVEARKILEARECEQQK